MGNIVQIPGVQALQLRDAAKKLRAEMKMRAASTTKDPEMLRRMDENVENQGIRVDRALKAFDDAQVTKSPRVKPIGAVAGFFAGMVFGVGGVVVTLAAVVFTVL